MAFLQKSQNYSTVVQEAGVQRVQVHRKMFWFGENPGKFLENPDKIYGNLWKICENLRKIPEYLEKNSAQTGFIWKKWRPTLFHLKKMAPIVCRITSKPFWRSSQRKACLRKWTQKKFPKIFPSSLGKFGQRYFAPSKICLLLHLSYTMYISWDSINQILKQGMQIGTTY